MLHPSSLPSQALLLCALLLPAAQPLHALQSAAAAQPWQPIGPSQVLTQSYGALSGRVTSVALDPADPTGNTVLLGSAGGGAWRSTNAASATPTFTPLTDTLLVFNNGEATASLAIGAVTIQPGGTEVLLAGTGEAAPSPDAHYGEGLLRSTNNGASWSLVPGSNDGVGGNHSFTGEAFAAFAWGPGSGTSQTVVAALASAGGSASVGAVTLGASVRGIYVSQNAGLTWQLATLQDITSGGITQTVQGPDTDYSTYDGNSALAVLWNPQRQLFFAAIQFHGLYSSPDGLTWTRLTTQPGSALTLAACPTNPGYPGSPTCPFAAAALATNPTTGDTFLWSVDADSNDGGLWQDVCNPASGSCSSPVTFAANLPTLALQSGSGQIPEGSSGLSLAVIPTPGGSDATLLAAAQSLAGCGLNSGCTWQTGLAASAAPGVRTLATLPGTRTVLLGTQGGLWSSTNAASTFTNLNQGLGSLAQLTSLAGTSASPQTVLAGMAALGTAGTQAAPTWTASSTASAPAWPQLQSGLGGNVALDYPNAAYAALGAGVQIGRCQGPACLSGNFSPAIGASQVSNDQSLPQPPYLLDPANSSQLLVGTCRLWRGPATGSNWSSANLLSPMLDGNQQPSCSGNALVRSIAAGGPASATGSSVVYAGMQGQTASAIAGHLFVTTSANTLSGLPSWSDIALSTVTNGGLISTFNPGQFDVSSLFLDPHDPTGATVYATIRGFHVPHLYYSTNFGATWLNLSADLPDSPANAVLVDPNDANTVYVGMDTGVYYTRSIQQCASQNCWQVYGAGLPDSAVLALAAASGSVGLLRAATQGRGAWQLPLATAALASQTTLQLSPASLTFPPQQVSTLSPSQPITATVTGVNPLLLTQIAITGDFTQSSNCTPAAIPVAATCVLNVSFAPSATGTRTGTLTLFGNLPNGQAGPIPLSGTGLAPPSIQLSPSGTLSFGTVTVGQTSAAQAVEVENTGQSPAALTSFSTSGNFAIAQNSCGTTLAANSGCVLTLTFTPTAGGPQSGALTVADSAGSQTLNLLGIGATPASLSLSPQSLQFPPTSLGQTSAPLTLTVTNAGDLSATLTGLAASGDFLLTSGCGQQVAGNSSCLLSVTFAPTQNGLRTGTLTLQTPTQTLTAQLSGTGLGTPLLTLTPATLNFGSFNLGQSSPPQTITVTNTGNAPDTITSVSTSTATTGTQDYATSTNCTQLAPAASCSITVTFTPSVAGPDNGTLTLNASVPNSSVNAQLTGSGNTLAFSAGQSPTATVPAGQTASYAVQMQSVGVTGTIQLACAGLPQPAQCTFVSLPPAQPAGYITVQFAVSTGPDTTGPDTTASLPGAQPLSPANSTTASAKAPTTAPPTSAPTTIAAASILTLALLLPLTSRALRTRLLLSLLAAALLLTLPTACGTSASATPATVAPGTYTFTLSATGAGLTARLPITLVVQ